MASRNLQTTHSTGAADRLEPRPDCCSEDAAQQLTREQRRSRRRHKVRGKSISTRRLSHWELELGRQLFPEEETAWRPRTRADCATVPRPCPFVSCKHNLYLDVSGRTGSIKLNFPDLDVDQMCESCVLDIADRGGLTLGETGAAMNLTRERVRQLERSGMVKLNALTEMTALRDLIDLPEATPEKHAPLSADDFAEDQGGSAGDAPDEAAEGDDIDTES